MGMGRRRRPISLRRDLGSSTAPVSGGLSGWEATASIPRATPRQGGSPRPTYGGG
jgi:hypothetical protein